MRDRRACQAAPKCSAGNWFRPTGRQQWPSGTYGDGRDDEAPGHRFRPLSKIVLRERQTRKILTTYLVRDAMDGERLAHERVPVITALKHAPRIPVSSPCVEVEVTEGKAMLIEYCINRSDDWYTHTRWRRRRQQHLNREPLCAWCEQRGHHRASRVLLTMSVPHHGDHELFWKGELISPMQSLP